MKAPLINPVSRGFLFTSFLTLLFSVGFLAGALSDQGKQTADTLFNVFKVTLSGLSGQNRTDVYLLLRKGIIDSLTPLEGDRENIKKKVTLVQDNIEILQDVKQRLETYMGTGFTQSGIINTGSVASKGSVQGFVYIPADASGSHLYDNNVLSNLKLDAVRYPFTGIECPAGYERIGLGLRREGNGAQNYQVLSCVKSGGSQNFDTMPKGSVMGIVYIPADASGTLINGSTTPVSNAKLDAVRYPFTGIECPVGSERLGVGLRKENNGTTNYNVYVCVKSTGSTDLANISTGSSMGILYLAADANGNVTNGETPISNPKLDAVRYPFTGTNCPAGFERLGLGLRKEDNGTKNYNVYTCVK